MKRKRTKSETRVREASAEYWAEHSSADSWKQSEVVDLQVHPRVKKPTDLSPRCPTHSSQILYSRTRSLIIADGLATLHKVRELYCPRGDYTRLAPETQELVKRVEVVVKRAQRDADRLAA